MRDTYSQLRQSAYELGTRTHPVDDSGGVRIKPLSHSTTNRRSTSRDVTLLETGMIVEHVDVKREEREERERRRKEERRERRRARKASRNSAVDTTSMYSTHWQSFAPFNEGGLRPSSQYAPSHVGRPTGVVTAPPLGRRPDFPRAYSQASCSDVHSPGSASPRRFLGFKNLSAGWRSQDSLAPSRMSGMSGMSGSMVDMQYGSPYPVCPLV